MHERALHDLPLAPVSYQFPILASLTPELWQVPDQVQQSSTYQLYLRAQLSLEEVNAKLDDNCWHT